MLISAPGCLVIAGGPGASSVLPAPVGPPLSLPPAGHGISFLEVTPHEENADAFSRSLAPSAPINRCKNQYCPLTELKYIKIENPRVSRGVVLGSLFHFIRISDSPLPQSIFLHLTFYYFITTSSIMR